MGRHRVEIKRIKNKARRQTTFTKRRDGLFKKVGELCKLCGVEAAVLTFTEFGNAFTYGNPSPESVIKRYLASDTFGRETEEEEEDDGNDDATKQVKEFRDKLATVTAQLEIEKKHGEMMDNVLTMFETL